MVNKSCVERKSKCKIFLSLNKALSLNDKWRCGVTAIRILNHGNVRCILSFTPLPSFPKEVSFGTHWLEGWTGTSVTRDLYGFKFFKIAIIIG